MKTVLIVDGYNAINAIPETKKLMENSLLSARSRLIMLTSEFVRRSGYITDFCVVFDGQDRYRDQERIHLSRHSKQSFSGTGEGDDKIIDTVRVYSSKKADRVIVASNDNYVRNNARGYGASLMNSQDIAGKTTGRKKSAKKGVEGSRDKDLPSGLKDKITRDYMKELGL